MPHFIQKGVDVRMGLDIAALALKRLVDTVIPVTGDVDLAPAMRFARREGLRAGLCALAFRGVHSKLLAHADFIVDAGFTPSASFSPPSSSSSAPASPAPAH